MATATVAAADTPSTPVTPSTLVTAYATADVPTRSAKSGSLGRKWFALRWQLSRTVFARPVPSFTEKLELKLGDFLVTLPIAAVFITVNAISCNRRDVGGTGLPATIMMLVTFALAVRNNSILLTVTGLPYERALFYHKFFGGVTWIVSGLHGLAYLLETYVDTARRMRRKLGRGDGKYEAPTISREFSGALTFYVLSALVVFSFAPIRRRFFECFLRSHWVLFILIVAFGVIHGAALMLVGFAPWAIDMLYRFGVRAPKLAGKHGAIHASQVTVSLAAKDIVKVQFPRVRTLPQGDGPAFHYEAGQYVFLCVPRVAKLEWHPFTIASAPHEPMVTIYIKVLGDWTKKLAAVALAKPASEPLAMLVDGPFGAVSIEMDQYAHFVFVSGGIGVTPMLSLANSLYFESVVAKRRRKYVEKAWFVWSVRDRETVEALILKQADAATGSFQSWLPHVLLSASTANSRERDAFYAELCLTTGVQDLTHSVDQRLASCLKHGQRPDVGKALREVGELAELARTRAGGKPVRVGVLVCGPAAMVADVVRQSLRLSQTLTGVAFDVHQETFAF